MLPLLPLDPAAYVVARADEIRLGQAIHYLADTAAAHPDNFAAALQQAYSAGQRVAIVGVPESIGPRANLGRGGAETAWPAFLSAFLNLQDNWHMPSHDILMLGQIDCADLQAEADSLDPQHPSELAQLRALCSKLDQRVAQILGPVFSAGFEVILVGGGHNNAYPLLRSLADTAAQPCAAVNLDPHADFRLREGRHSGNGFSYAYVEGALADYHIVGLHEGKNTAASLKQLADANFRYHSTSHLRDMYFTEAMQDVAARAAAWQRPLGIEVDIDAIQGVPASAINYAGCQVVQADYYVRTLAELPTTRYLHLAEAAPSLHPSGVAEGNRQVGQVLTELTLAYLTGRTRRP